MWFSLNTLFGWMLAYRYVILLPIAIIEGPIISVIAGFLVSIHAMEFWIVFGILVLGDVIGDMLLYGVCRWGGGSFITRWVQSSVRPPNAWKNSGGFSKLTQGKRCYSENGDMRSDSPSS